MNTRSTYTRRDALRQVLLGSLCCTASSALVAGTEAAALDFTHEAAFYEKQPNNKILCKLCPRECSIDNLERGFCGVRENRDGVYYTLVHSKPCTIHLDPIEKKPLFHYLPGTTALSIATVGCNMDCKFCQNWDISQLRPEQARSFDGPPEKIAHLAIEHKSPTIAYTYSEPVVFYEYVRDVARAGHVHNIRSVMITNGYIHREPMAELVRDLDAVKIDLKAFTEKYYKDICIGELQPVLKTLALLRSLNIWTEIVYLVVPTLNDSPVELRAMCRWIVKELGPDVPVHFSRFHPEYKLKNLPPTPLATLETAWAVAREVGCRYVYLGNVPGHRAESTWCPSCGHRVVHREGFRVIQIDIKDGKCQKCGVSIAGVWR